MTKREPFQWLLVEYHPVTQQATAHSTRVRTSEVSSESIVSATGRTMDSFLVDHEIKPAPGCWCVDWSPCLPKPPADHTYVWGDFSDWVCAKPLPDPGIPAGLADAWVGGPFPLDVPVEPVGVTAALAWLRAHPRVFHRVSMDTYAALARFAGARVWQHEEVSNG